MKRTISMLLAILMLAAMPLYVSAASKDTTFVVRMVRNNQFETQEFWAELDYSATRVYADTDWNTAKPDNDDTTTQIAVAGIKYYNNSTPGLIMEDTNYVTADNRHASATYVIDLSNNETVSSYISKHQAIIEIANGNRYESDVVPLSLP